MTIAREIMTSEPYTVTPGTPVRDLAAELTARNYSGAPVVDSAGRLVGVVTVSDVIYQRKNLHLPTVIAIFDAVIPIGGGREMDHQISKMLGSTVREIMTDNPTTVDEDMPLEDIATIMSEQGKHLLPVTRGGALVGVIDRSDVLRAIVKGE